MTSTRQRPMRPGRALTLVSAFSLALAIMLSASCAAPREESTPSPSATEVAPTPTPEPEPVVPEAKPAPPAEALRGVEDAKGETEQETGVAPDEPAELDDGVLMRNERPAAQPAPTPPSDMKSPKLKSKDKKRCAPGEPCEEEDPSLLRKMPGR